MFKNSFANNVQSTHTHTKQKCQPPRSRTILYSISCEIELCIDHIIIIFFCFTHTHTHSRFFVQPSAYSTLIIYHVLNCTSAVLMFVHDSRSLLFKQRKLSKLILNRQNWKNQKKKNIYDVNTELNIEIIDYLNRDAAPSLHISVIVRCYIFRDVKSK